MNKLKYSVKSLSFVDCIILTQKFYNLQRKNMQNYQILQYYPMHYESTFAHYCYYEPIMLYHPTYFVQIPNCNDSWTQNYRNPAQIQQKASQGEIPLGGVLKNHEKSETLDLSDENMQKSIGLQQKQAREQYFKVSNRNILPNNINLLLSYIRRINKSGKMVEKIIQKSNPNNKFTTKKFYAYQGYIKQKIPFHKTKHTLQEIIEHTDSNQNIFTLQQQNFYNKVCRILIENFLQSDYLSCLLTSSKIHKTSKAEHLVIRRYLQLKLRRKEVNLQISKATHP